MMSFFKSKRVNVFLLFFSISLVFSVLTKLSGDYTKTLVYKLKPINVPEEKVIIEDSLHRLNLTVETHGFNYISIYFSDLELDVDFNKLDKTKSAYVWLERKQLSEVVNQFDSKVKIKAITPDTIFFRYDTNSTKVIPINLKKETSFIPGFEATQGFVISPDSVKVIGPKMVLDTISVVNTKQFVLKDINTSISKSVELDISTTENTLTYSQTSVTVEANVEKFTEGSFDVPVKIINVEEGINVNYYPKTVTVLFYTSLSNYKTIDESDFEISCDFNEINENNSFLTPRIVKQPEFVKNLRLETKKIEFILSQ